MSFALYKNKTVGLKIEATTGTRATVTPADYGLEVTDLTAASNVEQIEKNTFRGSISGTPSRIGKLSATVELGGELKNSGTAGTVPRIDTILKAARMARESVQSVTVGTATGAFVRGVTILTGATSHATVLALGLEAGVLYFVTKSGTLSTGETLTGGTFSATTSGAPVSGSGYLYSPASSAASEATVSLDVCDGGLLKQVYGAASTFSLTLSTTEYPKWAASFSGIAHAATWGTKAPVVSGIVYEAHSPAIVTEARLAVGGTYAPVASQITLDLGNSVNLIENLNSATWYAHAVVTQRQATGSFQVLADLDASADLYAALFAGSPASLEFSIGKGEGTQIDVICPAVQYKGIAESDSNSFLVQTINLGLNGDDQELLMWFR